MMNVTGVILSIILINILIINDNEKMDTSLLYLYRLYIHSIVAQKKKEKGNKRKKKKKNVKMRNI